MEKPFNARNNHKESVHKERTLLAPGLKGKNPLGQVRASNTAIQRIQVPH
jgi:hypothetical protein